VRITLGNYHVEPQSREARLWLVLTIHLKTGINEVHECLFVQVPTHHVSNF